MVALRRYQTGAEHLEALGRPNRRRDEEGLDQDFNSLDAQREAAEAYIHSQAHADWTCLPSRYDDGATPTANCCEGDYPLVDPL